MKIVLLNDHFLNALAGQVKPWLVDAIRRHVLTASKLHADDTPIPVLVPGNGKAKTARLWTYVRDDRSALCRSRLDRAAQ